MSSLLLEVKDMQMKCAVIDLTLHLNKHTPLGGLIGGNYFLRQFESSKQPGERWKKRVGSHMWFGKEQNTINHLLEQQML